MIKSPQKNSLTDYREKIDEIDSKIIQLLATRFDLIKEIAQYKKKHKLKLIQKQREKNMLKKLTTKAKSKSLKKEFVSDIFNIIFKESKNYQKKVITELDTFDKKAKN